MNCGAVGNAAVEIPVAGRHEGDPLALTLDDQPHRRALHPSGRQAPVDLAPQHLGHRVAEQAIDDAAGLLRIDQAVVDLAPVVDGVLDGGAA